MKNVFKSLLLALVVSSPIAIVAPAVHAETTSTAKPVTLTKTVASKTHHKAAISGSHTNTKSSKIYSKKHLKHYKHRKHTSTNLANKSTTDTAANKSHK